MGSDSYVMKIFQLMYAYLIKKSVTNFKDLFFIFLIIIIFLEKEREGRGRGRRKERERES